MHVDNDSDLFGKDIYVGCFFTFVVKIPVSRKVKSEKWMNE